jgi:hypothetical protein
MKLAAVLPFLAAPLAFAVVTLRRSPAISTRSTPRTRTKGRLLHHPGGRGLRRTFAIFYIEVNAEMDACFMAGPTPGVVPASGEGRSAALELMADLNSTYPFVKFEADPTSGEIMCTYTFSTENGVGFEAFAAMISVIFSTIEETADQFIALRQ